MSLIECEFFLCSSLARIVNIDEISGSRSGSKISNMAIKLAFMHYQ